MSRRLLLVHAHPDDETLTCGATMARYAAEGAAVTLVTCTLGEEGEICVPALAHLAADREDRLGEHRRAELVAAMAALGVADHRLLGGGRYRDSGMAGTAANARPDSFWRADLLDAADLLVPVVRETRPQVLVTYDERGGYGHPDHVQAHRVATYATALAAAPSFRPDLGPSWDVSKVYWTAAPRSQMERSARAVSGAGSRFTPAGEAELAIGVPDEVVTTTVDAESHLPAKVAALRAHATQVIVDEPFYALSNEIGHLLSGTEHFRLVRGRPGPGDPRSGRETDLFAGLAGLDGR